MNKLDPRIISTALIGLGHVGRSFLSILEVKEQRLAAEFGVTLRPVCVADSSGVALTTHGFDPRRLRTHKAAGGRVADLVEFQPGLTPAQAVGDPALGLDLVLEASPVNLVDGEPGLGVTRAALARGAGVVLANKGPLVLAFQELHALAAAHNAGLAFSATVCGALPVINIGRRDLVGAEILHLRGIFNSTSNFILDEMGQGRTYAAALAEAQQRGIAEADPSLDVEGWDTANKLVIIANSFLGVTVRLADVEVQGITGITPAQLHAATAQGQVIKLLASAERVAQGYQLTVKPALLPQESFLGSCSSWEMGIEVQSDLYGKMYHKIWEREPLPTAAAMLRDAINLLSPARIF